MIRLTYTAIALMCLAMIDAAPVSAAEPPHAATLHIDVPVALKASKVVFNMDHPTFAGDQSIGLMYMKLMLQNYKANQTALELVAVYHGMAGYILLSDIAYNKVRKTETGNPYKEQISALQQAGVRFEECGQTARSNGWVNTDLLPGVLVDAGANLRLVQLVQEGYIQLQP